MLHYAASLRPPVPTCESTVNIVIEYGMAHQCMVHQQMRVVLQSGMFNISLMIRVSCS
jgi:hypothetical protein